METPWSTDKTLFVITPVCPGNREEAMKHLDINQIKEIIPTRHPFALLLDAVEDYEPGSMQWGINA